MFRDAHRRWMKSRYELWQQHCPYPCVCVRRNYISQPPLLSCCFTVPIEPGPCLPAATAPSWPPPAKPLSPPPPGPPSINPGPVFHKGTSPLATFTTRACILEPSVRSRLLISWVQLGSSTAASCPSPSNPTHLPHFRRVLSSAGERCRLGSCILVRHTCVLAHCVSF